jgi:hypothetical protein
MPLQCLTPLFAAKRIDCISLQTEITAADRAAIESGKRLRHVGDTLRDFGDTAAVISMLDLVITVDTATAHLAGAMAKPVWIMLPFSPDWRWQLERRDSPWYPTARLFRQAKPGGWDGVIAQVLAEPTAGRTHCRLMTARASAGRDKRTSIDPLCAAFPQRLDALTEGTRPLGE